MNDWLREAMIVGTGSFCRFSVGLYLIPAFVKPAEKTTVYELLPCLKYFAFGL